jgi:hypothetical protein
MDVSTSVHSGNMNYYSLGSGAYPTAAGNPVEISSAEFRLPCLQGGQTPHMEKPALYLSSGGRETWPTHPARAQSD